MAVRSKMVEIPREVIEATARVLGPASAAAQALADADSHSGQSFFFRLGNMIIVQKMPAQTVMPS